MRKGQKKRSKPESLRDLDIKYLGQRLPGTPLQRAKLLDTLKEILEEEGAHWVDLNRDVLLKEAELLVEFWRAPSERGKKKKGSRKV